MNAFEALISRTLAKRIRAEIETRGTDIIAGVCLRSERDTAVDYASRTGEIKALMNVLMWIEESEREITTEQQGDNHAAKPR